MALITITLSKPVMETVLEVLEKRRLGYQNGSNCVAIDLDIAIREIQQKMHQLQLDLD
jgi:hypothetical protein